MKILFLVLSACGSFKKSPRVEFVLSPPSCTYLGNVEGKGQSLLSEITAGRNAMLELEVRALELGGDTVYTEEQNSIDVNRNGLRWKPEVQFSGSVYKCQK